MTSQSGAPSIPSPLRLVNLAESPGESLGLPPSTGGTSLSPIPRGLPTPKARSVEWAVTWSGVDNGRKSVCEL